MTIRLTGTALKLWRLLTERDATRYSRAEFLLDLGASKTGVLKAATELQELGLIHFEETER